VTGRLHFGLLQEIKRGFLRGLPLILKLCEAKTRKRMPPAVVYLASPGKKDASGGCLSRLRRGSD